MLLNTHSIKVSTSNDYVITLTSDDKENTKITTVKYVNKSITNVSQKLFHKNLLLIKKHYVMNISYILLTVSFLFGFLKFSRKLCPNFKVF